ncbi:MAG: hypothetical protein Q8N16_01150 [bacterium]|nr:hypothetical protein [bacterium]
MPQALFYGSLDEDKRSYLRQRVEVSRVNVDFVQFVIASGSLDVGLSYLGRAAGDRHLTKTYLTIVIWYSSEAIGLSISEEFHSQGADHVAWDPSDAVRFLR